MKIATTSLLQATNMSVALVSKQADVTSVTNFCIQANFSGSPSGILKLQASNDFTYAQNNQGLVTATVNSWVDVTDSSTNISASGNAAWDYADCGFAFVRLAYTPSSGSGTMTLIE